MKDLWNATIAGVKGWKIVLVKAALTTFVAGASVITAAMQGVEWDVLTSTQKFLILLGVAVAMANNMIAFLTDTLKDVADKVADKIKLP